MAIESKVDFLRKVEKSLSDIVTVSDMSRIMKAINDVLEVYEMRTVTAWTDEGDDLLNCYINALSVECRSRKTIDRYVYVIGKMMEYVKVPVRQVTVYHLRSFLSAEKERGICDQTLEGYRRIFSAYFNWLQRESLIDRNPTANLGKIKCAMKEKKIYSEVDMELLNSHCKTVRNKAIIHFLRSTGCRVSEMTELDRSAVDLDALECVVHGKGNKERTVYLSPVTGMLVGQYLDSRKDDNPALFIGKKNERLSPRGVQCMLKTLSKASGVEHVHPHKFRRTLATELSRHGMRAQDIQVILGHEKMDTTMGYINMNKDDVKSAYRRYA